MDKGGLEIAGDAQELCCAMLGWSPRTYYNHREELMKCGAVFQIWLGNPPKKVTKAFPSKIREWTSLKASKGEAVGQ